MCCSLKYRLLLVIGTYLIVFVLPFSLLLSLGYLKIRNWNDTCKTTTGTVISYRIENNFGYIGYVTVSYLNITESFDISDTPAGEYSNLYDYLLLTFPINSNTTVYYDSVDPRIARITVDDPIVYLVWSIIFISVGTVGLIIYGVWECFNNIYKN